MGSDIYKNGSITTTFNKAAELDKITKESQLLKDQQAANTIAKLSNYAMSKKQEADGLAQQMAGYGYTIGDVASMIDAPVGVAAGLPDREELYGITSQYAADQNNMLRAARDGSLQVDKQSASQWWGF